MLYKTGTLTVATGGTAQNLNIGFVPDYFYMVNQSNLATPVNDEIVKAEWFSALSNGFAIATNYTGSQPAIELNYLTSNGFTPFQTTDNLLYVPNQVPYTTYESTNLVITGISKAANASITATHSFTSADIGVTVVTFHNVVGMTQINTLRGVIQSVTSTTSFTVNINSTNFTTYGSGGEANVITGAPANTLYGNVSLPTAQANLGQIGLTLGTSLMTTTNDVWLWYAMLQSPATGP